MQYCIFLKKFHEFFDRKFKINDVLVLERGVVQKTSIMPVKNTGSHFFANARARAPNLVM